MEKRIALSTPTMHGEEMEFVKEAFEKNWIAPLGFNCDSFEEEMSAYLVGDKNAYHALSLCSGTAALHLAYKLAGIKRGDIVLCSDMTFSATVNPVSYEGGVQVFIVPPTKFYKEAIPWQSRKKSEFVCRATITS